MLNFYELKILPIILKTFKVNKIVICGLSDEEIVSEILKYCNEYNASYLAIDSQEKLQENFINDYSINILPTLTDFDAIFLNDDPNWFTIYNELNTIKSNNKEFPLVFICNNVFPHQRRDSYINPKIIPDEFLNEYANELKLTDALCINDNLFHAINDNTPKNGVLTAIEDFLDENKTIKIMNLHLLNGITILYPKSNISKIRIDKIFKESEPHQLNQKELTSDIIEKQSITNYISKFDITSSQLNQIKKYQEELENSKNDLNYKNTQIINFNSKLSLKDSEIKNIESKLINSENKILKLDSKLKESEIKINYLNNELILNEKNFKNKENKLNDKIKQDVSQINSLKTDISEKEKKELEFIKENDKKNNELLIKEEILKSLKQQYTHQFSKIENNKYCIACFKEEIENNKLEIQYYKRNSLIRKLFNPIGYLYLILKSNIRELPLNLKLYKAIKNSKCFDIGFYLSKNKDLQESKWCKYFSPELHYVCNGFNEKREFNKKYFNRNSKKELLDYILNCNQ